MTELLPYLVVATISFALGWAACYRSEPVFEWDPDEDDDAV